jgi:serine/threonine-protein kinase
MLAFVGVPAKAGNRLFLRRLSHLQATALPGTEGASDPFFSPDGQWIAFVAGGSLRKISTGGGAAVALCPAEAGYGGAWVEDGYIYFSPNSVSPLLRVSPSGGQPEKFTTIDPSRLENSHRWVHALPGGKAVLFSAGIATTFGEGNLMVQETKGGPPKLVQRGATFGIYLPDGRIFFMRQGSPFVAPFDLERLEITGQEAPLAESISSWVNSGSAQVSFASDGKMVYLAGRSLRDERVLEWIDPAGKTDPLRTELGFYTSLRFSPDGHSLAVTVQSATSGVDYWLYQWERKTMSRFTSDGVASGTAAWTPDSRRLTFSTRGTPNIFWQPADGSAQPERLTNKPAARQLPVSWHPSGKFLLFDETDSTGFRLMVLPMKGSEAAGWKPGTPYAFLTTTNFGSNASFSPDGRWVAYESVETGRPEVYVRPFPGPGGKWQISNDGGLLPTWSRNGKELIYRASDGRLMTCAYSAPGQAFLAASPRAWSEFPMTALSTGRNFDLHPDGKRMARIRTPDTTGETKLDHVVVVENILEELRGLTKAKD